ncbi:MAG: 30S ribosomal protein S12 methylthiotransferase RimO [Bacteroidales bacterium]|nr:30S ribosomal protein S12 methylthiotransferase RimO [Bacteroidales bacterium]
MKVQLITLGCSKNRVDSEHLLSQIAAAGISIAPEEAPLDASGADVVILNTCGFIADAKQESVDAIMHAVRAKNEGVIKRIYVFGCLSQRYNKELKEEIPEVDGFFGADDRKSLLQALGVQYSPALELRRHLTTPPHYAYLKISEGCDRSCAYCAIPGIRGRHVSVDMEALFDEASALAAGGVKELIVIAQDTTYYGLDLYKKRMIAPLLERLSQVNGIEWIRLHYSYPEAFPDDLLDVMAANPKICKYIDIPLQHCNKKVLGLMRRPSDDATMRALVEKFRTRVPGVALRTTMIVGHPGETEREFKELLAFVQDARFERLGAFTYSEEEGTFGAINYKDTVPQRVKQERYDRLMELQSGISLAYNTSRIGTAERVIVDSFEEGNLFCRTSKESPEVDGQVIIPLKAAPAGIAGNFINVKITDADYYDLSAQIL